MNTTTLPDQLTYLKLGFMHAHHAEFAADAARQRWPHADFLGRLVEGEVQARKQRAVERRIKQARFPVIKTLDQFRWDWPRKINEPQIKRLFALGFVEAKTNVLFLGSVGLGKTHLSVALGLAACQADHSVLFTTAVDAVNNLASAHAANRLKQELAKYASPQVLVIDEVGYIPMDKMGADLFFQIVSQRHERSSTILTSNLAYKKWPSVFNNDSNLTSAILDRLLDHAETVVIEGNSYRTKDRIDSPP
jgi:DNA replication protein DnaC